jgi:5-methylcytosine-specific restriction enzyme A
MMGHRRCGGRLTTLKPRIASVPPRVRQPVKRPDPVYLSPEWRALLAAIIAQRGRRCEDPACDAPGGRTDGRIYGDHIRELKDGGAPLDPANVILRCHACHERKTAEVRAGRMAARYQR